MRCFRLITSLILLLVLSGNAKANEFEIVPVKYADSIKALNFELINIGKEIINASRNGLLKKGELNNAMDISDYTNDAAGVQVNIFHFYHLYLLQLEIMKGSTSREYSLAKYSAGISLDRINSCFEDLVFIRDFLVAYLPLYQNDFLINMTKLTINKLNALIEYNKQNLPKECFE